MKFGTWAIMLRGGGWLTVTTLTIIIIDQKCVWRIIALKNTQRVREYIYIYGSKEYAVDDIIYCLIGHTHTHIVHCNSETSYLRDTYINQRVDLYEMCSMYVMWPWGRDDYSVLLYQTYIFLSDKYFVIFRQHHKHLFYLNLSRNMVRSS